jgi:hypothetical protein
MTRALELEKTLSPAKFTDFELPCYIIPIRPAWAAQLFDTRLAEQDLFGLPPELGFRLENAYYRARNPQLSAPARILWYVSKADGRYRGAGAIRAASYLDEVVVDSPKVLFSRFRRLGIYRWQDLLKLTKEDLSGALMALKFSGTELLGRPILWEEIQTVLQDAIGRRDQLQRPLQITTDTFFRLYTAARQTEGQDGS